MIGAIFLQQLLVKLDGMTDALITLPQIKSKIVTIHNQPVMLDRDLAEFYGVRTKRLNEAVKRNIERFPAKFRFQLTMQELNELVAVCDRFKPLKHSTNPPYAFTEQGVAMLSAVLRSSRAVEVSIKIMEAFVSMRHFLKNNAYLFEKFYQLGWFVVVRLVIEVKKWSRDLRVNDYAKNYRFTKI